MVKRRSASWVLFAVLAVGLLGSILVIGGCIVFLRGPVEAERTLRFEVDGGAAASVYVSGELVGATPLELSHEQLESHFEAYDGPWPPLDTSGTGSSRVGGFLEEDADFSSSDGDSIWYIRVSQDGVTEARALHYRVEAADGRVLDRYGSGSTGTTMIKVHKTDHVFRFH